MRPEHRDAVLRLWMENLTPSGVGDALAERYRWAYALKPAAAPATILALAEEGAEVIGCGSVYPRTVRVAGTELRVGMLADFAVMRAHRTAGAALGIQRALVTDQESGFSFLFGSPNKSAVPIMQRVGYQRFATAQDWVKPLSAFYKARTYVAPEWAARMAAAPVDWCLRAGDAWRRRDDPDVRSEIVDRADDRFDELWRRAQPNYVVAGERTAAYLNWRYGAFADCKYEFFCLSRGSDLVGYVAFSTQSDKVLIADLLALDMEETAEQLLLQFACDMRAAGYGSVLIGYAGNRAFAARLKRTGFIPRPGSERTLVALPKHTTECQTKLLLDLDNWYLFSGEMDL